MDKIFTLKEACEKGVSKIRDISWPAGQYIELSFVGTTPFPRASWHVGNEVYMLPVKGINENSKTFTFVEGISSYDEYFNKYAYKELSRRIKNMKERK